MLTMSQTNMKMKETSSLSLSSSMSSLSCVGNAKMNHSRDEDDDRKQTTQHGQPTIMKGDSAKVRKLKQQKLKLPPPIRRHLHREMSSLSPSPFCQGYESDSESGSGSCISCRDVRDDDNDS
jgi:hypothetical protein